MSKYVVTIKTQFEYDTDETEFITNPDEARQEAIDFLASGEMDPSHFDITVNEETT